MNNKEYWSVRLANKIYNSNTKEMEKALKRIYQEQAKDIKAAIIELYADMLTTGEISTTNLYKYGRYMNLLNKINTIINGTANLQVDLIQNALEKCYIAAFDKTSAELGQAISWSVTDKYMMEEVVNGNFKGQNFKTRIFSSQRKFINILKKQITDIVGAGLNKDAAVKAVMNKCGVAYYEADRLIRTETMRVINDGQKKAFIKNGYEYGYYLVSDDDRLCPKCNKLAVETKANPLPIESMEAIHHPQCRCTIIPIIKK